MSGDDEAPVVVIDNGSVTCKAGFAGDDSPQAVFTTVVGHPKYSCHANFIGPHDLYVGDDVYYNKYIVSPKYPIDNGIINNFDDMERVWRHIFARELRVTSEEHPVLITEVPNNPKQNREKMTEIMFETFKSPSVYVALKYALPLYASGRNTGVVFNCGEGVSYAIPMYEGCTIQNGITRLNLAGYELDDYLTKLLNERGCSFSTRAEKEVVREVKENICYVALDFDQEMAIAARSNILNQNYELADGKIIIVGNERFRCPEALFKPSVWEIEGDGIHKIIYDSIMKCDESIRKDLFKNIVISGGTTMFGGFIERLNKEIKNLAPTNTKVSLMADPDRQYSAWIGGSILGASPGFRNMWISKKEYDEYGPSYVNRKCF